MDLSNRPPSLKERGSLKEIPVITVSNSKTAGKEYKTICLPFVILYRHKTIETRTQPQKRKALFRLAAAQPFVTDRRLNAINRKTEKIAAAHCRTLLNKAGNNRNGKSGRNMNRVGNNDKKPMLMPAANRAVADKPAKLSLENRENSFSLKGFLKVTEHKNNKKQKSPAKAQSAVTGLGK